MDQHHIHDPSETLSKALHFDEPNSFIAQANLIRIRHMLSEHEEGTGSESIPLPSTRTEGQALALSAIMKTVACLSILASLCIIQRVRAKNNLLSHIYHRTMLTLSIYDVLASSAMFFGTMPIPKDNNVHSEYFYGNIGNEYTCTIQGVALNTGVLSVSICTAFLCLYFVMCVKYSWREDRLRKLEIAMRVCLLVAFVWGMIPIPFELYNPTEFFCWIQVYPINCDVDDEIDCIRGNHVTAVRWITAGVPQLLCIFCIVVSMVMLYRAVNSQATRMLRMSFSNRNNMSSLLRRRDRVFCRAWYHVSACVLVFVPLYVKSITSRYGVNASPYISFLVALFSPIQGVCNFAIYFQSEFNIRRWSSNVTKKFKTLVRRRFTETSSDNNEDLNSSGSISSNIHNQLSDIPSSVLSSNESERVEHRFDSEHSIGDFENDLVTFSEGIDRYLDEDAFIASVLSQRDEVDSIVGGSDTEEDIPESLKEEHDKVESIIRNFNSISYHMKLHSTSSK